jgi:hypothetical protein
VYRLGCGTVGLLGAGPSDAVATHVVVHEVENVYWPLKSGSGWRAAMLVPLLFDAKVTTV